MYYYPEEKRPDTKDDLLSLGFITPSIDAVLVRIDSQGGDMHNDYLQLEIVSFLALNDFSLYYIENILSSFTFVLTEWRKGICELQSGI